MKVSWFFNTVYVLCLAQSGSKLTDKRHPNRFLLIYNDSYPDVSFTKHFWHCHGFKNETNKLTSDLNGKNIFGTARVFNTERNELTIDLIMVMLVIDIFHQIHCIR